MYNNQTKDRVNTVVKKQNKNKRLNKKTAILIVVITLLCAAVIALTWGLIATRKSKNEYKHQLENVYQRAFFELVDSSSNVEVNLSKMLAAGSDSQNAMLVMETYSQAQTALESISSLPKERESIQGAEKFYNQVADWCLCYSKCIVAKGETRCYDEQAEDLYITAKGLSQAILDEAQVLQENNFNILSMTSESDKNKRKAEGADEGNSDKMNVSVDYPELIYDGPFSDSAAPKCYKALESLAEISYDEAESKVRESFTSIKTLSRNGESAGDTVVYHFSGEYENGTNFYCSLSKKGGMFLNIDMYREVIEKKIDRETASTKAVEYAKIYGYEVEPVWYNESENIAYVNMAPIVDGITYYTDLVKAKIAMDNGEMLGIESTGFCINNCKRDYSATISKNAAKASVKKTLNVTDARLAVIPLNQKEILSYMVSAEYKGLDYFIFIDAETGKELNIMRVINDDQGELVF